MLANTQYIAIIQSVGTQKITHTQKGKEEQRMLYFDKRKFEAQMTLKGVTRKEVAEAIGVSEGTLYNRLKDDGNFTRAEIGRLIEFLDIVSINDIFFTDKLA